MGVVDKIYSRNAFRKPYEGRRNREIMSLSESIGKNRSMFGMPVIAEFKRQSPSGFKNSRQTDLRNYVKEIEAMNVAGLSILTEPDEFLGSYRDIVDVNDFQGPILDKDFISTGRMIEYAYNAGADCILLIADFLPSERISSLSKKALSMDMEVLIEFHDPESFKKIPDGEGIMIGYNRRNLRTLKIEGKEEGVIDTLKRKEVIWVLESGLQPSMISQSHYSKFDAFLIGEAILNGYRTEVNS